MHRMEKVKKKLKKLGAQGINIIQIKKQTFTKHIHFSPRVTLGILEFL